MGRPIWLYVACLRNCDCLETQSGYGLLMHGSEGVHWTTDDDLFLSLEGAKAVADWFGYIPSFHDASIDRLELGNGAAELALRYFRMTDEVNERGYFVLDRHALITIHLHGVTGVSLTGNAGASVDELGIRRVAVEQTGWDSVAGPDIGDLEVRWKSNVGLQGAIFARDVRFSLVPTEG
jgi:hypothetical protein